MLLAETYYGVRVYFRPSDRKVVGIDHKGRDRTGQYGDDGSTWAGGCTWDWVNEEVLCFQDLAYDLVKRLRKVPSAQSTEAIELLVSVSKRARGGSMCAGSKDVEVMARTGQPHKYDHA